MALRAEVVAMVAATQLSTGAAQPGGPRHAELERATEEACHEVSGFLHDYYDRKIFEPYLRFASPEDEAIFRKNEAEREAAARKAHAEGTPQGELRAIKLAVAQMEDAGAHGADRSPHFAHTVDALRAKQNGLEAAMNIKAESREPQPDPLANLTSAALVDSALIASLRQSGARCSSGDECYTAQDVRQTPQGRLPS